jgi:hypothetical protein
MYGSDVASSNRNDGTNTKAVFCSAGKQAKSLGYVEIQPMMDSTQWHDYYKSRTSLTNGEVYVSACKPQNCYGGMTVSNEFALRDPPDLPRHHRPNKQRAGEMADKTLLKAGLVALLMFSSVLAVGRTNPQQTTQSVGNHTVTNQPQPDMTTTVKAQSNALSIGLNLFKRAKPKMQDTLYKCQIVRFMVYHATSFWRASSKPT